jgi:sulfite reductase (NADPH) flavoprotein alpha-component
MAGIPYIPSSAPFTPEQRAWLNGYLAGLFADANLGEPGVAAQHQTAPAKPAEPLLVLYGSQSGTAEGLAKKFAKEAKTKGFEPRVMELNAAAQLDLTKEPRAVIITSTWGDGEPPDNATAFWSHISADTAPKLENLNYSVLALGDKNYSEFCGAGKKFDERLESLGAKRVHPRVDCDLDYEAPAKGWMEGVWPALLSESVNSKSVISEPRNGQASSTVSLIPDSLITSPTYSRTNPFPARLVTNRKLNAPDSAKDTRHFEISLKDSGLTYEVGDALGVVPQNCPALVDDIIRALGCDGEEAVTEPSGKETSLRSALLRSYQITKPGSTFLQKIAELANDAELKSLLEPARKADLDKFLYGREVIDVLLRCPAAKLTPKDFVALLAKLQPRLYSISSSPKAHPGEVHLTVAAVRYGSHGRARKGVCSTFLADRVDSETPVPVFVQTSHGFRIPTDGTKPMIMIGPGTGIAPFRAFLEERRAIGATGKNWLFFGDQQKKCDFLYQEQLEGMLAEGTLTRLDLAFSRDQAEKIYVQTRMLEQSAELWRWLEDGAHLYVCGDAKRMAKDVDAALHEIIQKAGGKSADDAKAYVAKLKSDKRYQRDVY